MIYIRTDMNCVIATGHVMRCLSIADAARMIGEKSTFILADEQAKELVEGRGYDTIILHTQWDDMDSEVEILAETIRNYNIKSILIDSYQVTQYYLSAVTAMTKTIYIDDRNAFVYPVDKLICYANYYEKFKYAERYDASKLYLGLQYVPLRKAFCGCEKKEIRKLAGRLLFMSGGTDNYDVLRSLLEKIDTTIYEQIDVICGMYYPHYEDLYEKYSGIRNVRIHKAVNDIENYMRQADLAVAAGGMTLYELCAIGTPTISYAIADNQLENVKTFQQDDIIPYAGDARTEDVISNIIEFIERYKQDEAWRQAKSQSMQKQVDGKGALRIAEIANE